MIQDIPCKIILREGSGGPSSGSLITEIPKIFLIILTKKRIIMLFKAKEISKLVRRKINEFFTA